MAAPPVILTVSPENIALDSEGSTSYSNTVTVVGTAVANSTITVYDGATALGTVTTNSSGEWTYVTSALADGAHSFTATATVSGSTSAPSSAVVETVVGSITNFSPLTDQWSAPISVSGNPYYVENANVNGNAPWAITQTDSHTLRFEVRPADMWPDNDSHRSEISGATVFAANETIDVSYDFMVEPGFNDTSNNLAWQILGQFHADDNNPIYQSISGGNPPFAIHLTGANGIGEGDYLAIQAFYALPGQTTWTTATLPGDPLNGYLYVSPTPIVRGQYNDVQIEVNFQNNSSGFLEVWLNGNLVVDYHGPIGYGGGVYWKEGVYEGWSSNQTIAVDYSNTVVTSAPGAPLILGNVVNGNQVILNGTAQANSTVTVYDGSTNLGTVTTAANGAWFFETGTLSIGSHNLTARATDSAGNVSAASSLASASIASFTGPIISRVATSAPAAESVVGNTITFTLTMSSAVTVTGTPTLSLNDGGTAAYTGGSGTNTLTFSYTVGAGDNTVRGLAITGANLPGGATIRDGSGNAALLTGAAVQFPGMIIDTQPVQTPVFGSPVANSDGTFTFAGTAGANTTVYFKDSNGSGLGSAIVDSTGHWTFTTPTLSYGTWNNLQAYDVNSLGDVSAIGTESGGGFGDYVNLPNSPTITGNALTGGAVTLYGTVTAGLSITSITVFDGATQLGTATINADNSWSFTTSALANGVHTFSARATNPSGTSGASAPDLITVTGSTAIDTTPPSVASVVASGTGITAGAGDLGTGSVVTLTVNLSEAVTVAGGVPTLTLNDGGTATYVSGSGTSALTFSYTVAAGQNTSDLTVTAFNLNSATVRDGAGNAANLSGAVTNPAGTLQIDTTAPSVASVVASGTGITAGAGDLGTGSVVTLTVNLSEAVTVAGGVPTLTLNDGGTATYVSGSGTNALTFSYTVAAGQNTNDLTVTAFNLNSATVRDGAGNAANLSGAVTNPAGTLQIDTTAPSVASVVASGTGITAGAGDLGTGSVVTLTVNLSEAVTVAGGVPTLTLNDGGTATYVSGSGTNALTFSYTVAAGQNTSDLTVTAFNLNSATVRDGAGNAANLSGAVTNPAGTLQIDTTAPSVASVVASGTGITAGAGDLGTGSVVTLTVNLSEAVTVAGGVPTLTLNDGGTATYVSGSGTNALTFSYTVAAGQNTNDLTVTAFNLNSATVRDGAGNAANLSGAVTNPAGTLQIDTTAPSVASVVASGTGITAGAGDLGTGSVVTLTVNLSEAVTVAGGVPTLTLNDGGTATYVSGSGTSALTFSYTVAAGQNTSDLTVTAFNLNSATVRDGAGNAANLSGAVTNPAGTLQIDTTAPSVASVVASGTGITAGAGDLGTGSVVTLTVNLSEAVTVAGGVPTLTLNDGGTATYVSGSGTSALTFSYTVAAGQNTSDLTVTAFNLNSATVRDGAGNAANLSGAVTNPAGTLQIDTTAPSVASVVASGTGITAGAGDLGTGSVVTLTVNLSEAVTVAGGVPTLTLNDGGTATYVSGSGTSALTFSYTVAAGQNTNDLTVTAFNLNSATVRDGAGNAANLSGAVTNPAGTLQIDTTAPTVSQATALPVNGTEFPGDLITLTLTFSEAVSVSGVPTLSLNDGGTATYAGGSGTNTLTFSYIVSATDSTVPALAVTQANLPNGATIRDGAGNAADLAGALVTFNGLAIDPPAFLTSVVESPSTGDLNAGNTVTLTLNMSSAVTVAGGTPTLTLNDGGAATYVSGSGTNALTFSYTVAAGQNTAALAATAVNLNGATIQDSTGTGANLSFSGITQTGPQIDTTVPSVASVVASGTGITAGSGDVGAGSVVTLTVNLSEAVTVAGGTPTLTLNDGGTATYVSGSGSSSLTFSYTVAAGQNTNDLTVTAFNLNSATIRDGAGNAANLSGAVSNPSGTLQIDTTAPSVTSVVASGTGITAGAGTLGTGSVVALTVNLSEAVTVAGGTPTLTLNDGGTATYVSGSGTNALTFSYTVAAGQNTNDLTVTAFNLNSATVRDGAGNAANLSGAVTNPSGTLQIVTGATIESFGSTQLVQSGGNYYLNPVSGGTGPLLRVNGSAVVAPAPWTLIGAEQTASGYEVAWFNTSTNVYTIWNTDSSGNETSVPLANASGSSSALQSIETSFHQDLNGDGVIGVPAPSGTVIESFGSTQLFKVGSNYYLNPVSGGMGPLLTINGSAVVASAPWTLIGAEQTASGYEVAWFNASSNVYTIWNTDSSGHETSVLLANASGSSSALQAFETSFHQDLNGDGVIGVPAPSGTVIESFGSTQLFRVGSNYYLNPVSGGMGPLLTINGSAVVAPAPWALIGAEQTASGYEVAWFNTSTNVYTIWNTDSSGHETSVPLANASGNSSALQAFETSFQQDLNGDGVIIIPAGQSMELTSAFSGQIIFGGPTGTLKIDHAASFTGTIGGQLAVGDVIDLADITSGAGATLAYSGNNSPGTLSVSDGTHIANIALLGNYTLANFTASNDGHGGTSVVDPPLQDAVWSSKNLVVDPADGMSSSKNLLDDVFDAALNQKLALWSQTLASAFPSSGFGTDGASRTGLVEGGQLSELTKPMVSQLQRGLAGSDLNA